MTVTVTGDGDIDECVRVTGALPVLRKGLCFALPFEEHVAVSAAAGPAPGSWMLESFITHGFKRWSITPNYALDTRRLKVRIQALEVCDQAAQRV